MATYRISYIVTTYNKLAYLQQVLGRLIQARRADEEIVVADGGSSDGTTAYLRQLFEEGRIQQFISERDKGEAHGFNKGMMMARGEVVKIVTDDDAYHYPTIRRALEFMEANPDVDVVLGNCAKTALHDLTQGRVPYEPAQKYQEWLQNRTPFWMIALPMMVRRKSLALTGLFATGIVLIDLEFIYRITSLKTNIAWCSGVLSMHLDNADGNFNRMKPEAIKLEHDKARFAYARVAPPTASTRLQSAFEAVKRPIRPAKRLLFARLGLRQIEPAPEAEVIATNYQPAAGEGQLEAAYRVCDEFMEHYNQTHPIEFVYKAGGIDKVLQKG
ncbi:glycosyltransferase [Hymenobacter ruricola]|uniref:Glycosyltransferase n=1 Tax=Hymenobacter ruricola TaxID=2791023 RepID=A0ABS0I6I4_9BACT|nr:glycosyltransferase [Hymenobacter ruricola]MBF9222149.1 glycosyltransferase [Hymenobacter ruricola]